MLHRPPHNPGGDKGADFVDQMAAAAGVTPGELLGRPEVAGDPESDLLALARVGTAEREVVPTPEYSLAYANWLADEAENLANQLEDGWDRDGLLVEIAESYSWLRDPQEVLDLASQITHREDHETAVRYAALQLVRAGDIHGAKALIEDVAQQDKMRLEMVEELVKQPIDQSETHELAGEIFDLDLYVRATTVLAQIGDRALFEANESSVQRHGNEKSKAGLIEAYIELGEIGEAESLIGRMRWADTKLYATTLAKVAGAYIAVDDLETALYTAERLRFSRYENLPFSEIVKQFAARGKFFEAEKAALEVYEEGIKDEMVGNLALEYARHGQLEKANEKINSLQIPSDRQVYSFRTIAAAAEGGSLTEASARVSELDEPSARCRAYAQLATIVAKRAQGVIDD